MHIQEPRAQWSETWMDGLSVLCRGQQMASSFLPVDGENHTLERWPSG